MEALLIIVFIVIVIVAISSLVLTISASPSLCKKVYEELPSKTFYRNGAQIYDVDQENYIKTYRDGFVWFLDDNSFKISNGVYLHNFPPTYLSPIHLYWLIKYRRWFKENIDINKIEKF